MTNPRKRILDLNRVVQETESIVRPLIGKCIRLVTVLAPRPCLVRANPWRLKQALLNLVMNGLDAMPEGGARLLRAQHLLPCFPPLDQHFALQIPRRAA